MNVKHEYEMLRLFDKTCGKMMTAENEFLQQRKRQLRSYLKYRDRKEFNQGWVIVSTRNDEPAFVEKMFFYDTFTHEEMVKWYDDLSVEVNSPYDCTGQWFTYGIEFYNFKQPNSIGAKSVVYRRWAKDI